MKKIGFLAILLVASFGIFSSKANAQTVSFDIIANSAWNYNYQDAPSIKDSGNSYSGVAWKTSNKSSHKMWFRVIDGSERQQGSAGLLSYLTTDAFKTNLTTGSKYYLEAKREHVIDPSTRVTGTWLA